MEPVFMILAQSAAVAARMAMQSDGIVQNVEYRKLEQRLRELGQALEWTPSLSGTESVSAPLIPTSTLPGIVMDDSEGKKTGRWFPSTRAADRKVGTGYVHDGNENKGQTTISFTPDLPAAGEYEIILIAPSNPNRAANVPILIQIKGRETRTMTVNLRTEEGRNFHPVARLPLPAGIAATITVSNRNTDGYVVVDGIQLVAPR
jgi:hypothetical protein